MDRERGKGMNHLMKTKIINKSGYDFGKLQKDMRHIDCDNCTHKIVGDDHVYNFCVACMHAVELQDTYYIPGRKAQTRKLTDAQQDGLASVLINDSDHLCPRHIGFTDTGKCGDSSECVKCWNAVTSKLHIEG